MLAACGEKNNNFVTDTVLESGSLSGKISVSKDAVLTIPENVTIEFEKGTQFSVEGSLDVKGTMKLSGVEWQNFFDGSSGTLNLHKGCDLFIDDNHVIGDEGEYTADILLGNSTYAAYESGTAVMQIIGQSDSVKINGKVHVNHTIKDDRLWDLGYDSAAYLYADQKIAFKSVRDAERPVTACVYTYGGKNTGRNAAMSTLNALYMYQSNRWTQIAVMSSADTILGYYTAMAQVGRRPINGEIWNGEVNYLSTKSGEDGQRIANIKYADRGGNMNKYDLWLPKNIVDGKDKDKDLKVILFLSGGSWQTCDKDGMGNYCAAYAKKGYVTATMNYRVVKQDIPQNSNDIGTIKDMQQDIFDCITSIKQQLKDRGYNVSGMAISGQSAGAHLAMLYAGLHYEGSETPSPIPVKLVMEECGPTGFTTKEWANSQSICWQGLTEEKFSSWAKLYPDPASDPNWHEKQDSAAGFISGVLKLCNFVDFSDTDNDKIAEIKGRIIREENNPESEIYGYLKQISPALNWSANGCRIPVVGIQGEADGVVSYYGPYAFKKTLDELNVDNTFVFTPLNGHLAQAEDETAYKRYFEICDEYLNKYLK